MSIPTPKQDLQKIIHWAPKTDDLVPVEPPTYLTALAAGFEQKSKAQKLCS